MLAVEAETEFGAENISKLTGSVPDYMVYQSKYGLRQSSDGYKGRGK